MKSVALVMLAAALIAVLPCIYAQSTAFSDRDQTFLKDSGHDNAAEVHLAQLAVRSSKDPAVVTFAKKMIEDHQKLLDEARPVAMKAGVSQHDGESMGGDAEYLRLEGLSGNTFDKSYIKKMVSDHHKDLESARAEHEGTHNEDMRRLSARAQEVIARHVEMVDRIAVKLGV